MKHILFFLLLCPAFVMSQQRQVQVNGYVTDSETGERLPGAYVFVGTLATCTNSYGYYTLTVPEGNQHIRASYIGYTAYEKELFFRSDTTLSFALKGGIDLSEVVVTSKEKHLIENKGMGSIRVDVSQLSVSPLFLGERDIIKTMQFLPGVSSGMEGSSNLSIRGGTNDQTLYLMDDMPVYNQNHTFGLISIFNPDVLLGAEVHKGGIPAIYGNRLSGVAAIALKDGNMKSHHQRISMGFIAGTLSAEGPVVKDKISYMFAARKSLLDLLYQGFMTLAEEGSSGGPIISFWDLNGKLTWKMSDKTHLSLGVYSGNDKLGGMNKSTDYKTDEKIIDKFGFGWQTTSSSLRLTSGLRQNMFLSSSLYYSRLDNIDYHDLKTPEFESKQNIISRMQEIGWRTSLEYKPGNRHTLFAGYDASLQQYIPEYLTKKHNGNTQTVKNGQKNLLTTSLFAYDEIRFRQWLFVPGLRLSFYHTDEKDKIAIEPRLKISTFINDNNKLMVAYDRMTQPIHSVNEMNYSVQNDYWLPFNEDRLPTSDQISVGWKNYSVQNFTLTIEAYYKKMQNLIMIRDLENYMDFHTDYQAGSGRSMGVELMAQYKRGRFSSWLAYTLSKAERTFGGRTSPFKYDAPHDLSASASYVVRNKNGRKNTLSINMQYRSGFPYYVSEISYPSMPQPDAEYVYTWHQPEISYIPYYPNTRITDFFRTDLNFSMEKQLKKGMRRWQFSLLNATGHQNPYAVYRKDGKYKAFLLIPFLPSISFTRYF